MSTSFATEPFRQALPLVARSVSRLRADVGRFCQLLKLVYRARSIGLLHLSPVSDQERIKLVCQRESCGLCCSHLGSPYTDSADSVQVAVQGWGADRQAQGLSADSFCGGCKLHLKGICSVYKERPQACREYPWYNVDGKVYVDRGCPGLRYDARDVPDVSQVRPAARFFSIRKNDRIGKLMLWAVCRF